MPIVTGAAGDTVKRTESAVPGEYVLAGPMYNSTRWIVRYWHNVHREIIVVRVMTQSRAMLEKQCSVVK